MTLPAHRELMMACNAVTLGVRPTEGDLVRLQAAVAAVDGDLPDPGLQRLRTLATALLSGRAAVDDLRPALRAYTAGSTTDAAWARWMQRIAARGPGTSVAAMARALEEGAP